MLKRTMTYVDYDGNQRTEDFYFNLTKAEVIEMEYEVAGGLVKMLEDVIATRDINKIILFFKDLVLRAYGVKSPDGRRFQKSQELRDEFFQIEAYSDLFMDLASDADKAAAFVNGIIPQTANNGSSIPAPNQ